ncbi:MAG: FAD:protein FMN transferase [Treponema sp.]|jgi:thiamine biosynthesis lipoprotein|nr:FAD:protein FMN transferase [Treponema sp.]
MKHLFLVLCAGIATGSLIGCVQNEALPGQTQYALDTLCVVNLYQGGTEKLYTGIFARIREIENFMSVTIPGSDIDKVNKNAGIQPVGVHPEVLDVVERAIHYAELSEGAFDPTVGPLVSLWGIGSDHPRLPSEEEIAAALDLVNWRDLVVDRPAGTLYLKRPGMALDLGAIAKGYAADETVKLLAKTRVTGAIINLGASSIFAYGEKEGQLPWRVGVQDPLDENRGDYMGILEIRNKTVVTSGVYERFFEQDGVRYHHILSTKTGRPVENKLLSVTIIADQSTDADALSTAVFALGYEAGSALIESLPGIEGVFIFDDQNIRYTSGVSGIFTLTSDRYRPVY